MMYQVYSNAKSQVVRHFSNLQQVDYTKPVVNFSLNPKPFIKQSRVLLSNRNQTRSTNNTLTNKTTNQPPVLVSNCSSNIKNGNQLTISSRNSNNINRFDNRNKKNMHKTIITLPFKVAIMIHIYDSQKVTISLLNSILKLLERYDKTNFHWYVNIAINLNTQSLKSIVEHLLKNKAVMLKIITNQNQGGDIGGFLLLSEAIYQSQINYNYCYFFHTKTNNQWRNTLVSDIVNIKLENLDDINNFGLTGSRFHLHQFKYYPNCHYDYHFKKLCQVAKIPLSDGDIWYFIGGTIFLFNIQVVEFLNQVGIKQLHCLLNTTETIDVNWQNIAVNHCKKNLRNTNNDYHYRQLYKCSLVSDFMIEHTFERFFGLIVQHLKLKVYGA